MPWKSKAQERWGNSASGHEALGDAGVNEFNAASKGKKLPAKKGSAMPPKGKYKATMHEYDNRRPKKQVMTKVTK